jgi:hypothetical protein
VIREFLHGGVDKNRWHGSKGGALTAAQSLARKGELRTEQAVYEPDLVGEK